MGQLQMVQRERASVQTRPASVQIKLFGAPQIIINGQPATIARRQLRALLYRLAAAPGPVARDHLCFLLWPDIDEAAARRNLTVLLNLLRQALPSPDLLVTHQDAITLDSTMIEVDVLSFKHVYATVANQEFLGSLQAAVALYDGPFLQGFTLPASAEFDAWADQERQHWEQRYIHALSMLIEGGAAQGEYDIAIDAAQRALAVDELAEDVHRRLIEVYAMLGDRTKALQQFERLVVVLERELGVSPLPETRAVYEAARDGRVPVGHHALPAPVNAKARFTQAHARVTPHKQVSSTTLPAPASPLIGRAEDLASLSALVQSPNARLLTLSGAGGSGKTRLALHVAWNVRDHFADGVTFVSLAPIQKHDLVVDAIAQAFGLHEAHTMSALDVVRSYVRDKHTLLVLDNFEHVLDASTTVAELVRAAPRLHVLVTSRALLNVSEERAVPVAPLPLPDLAQLPPVPELAEQPAVALLLARAQAHTPSFQLTDANAADIAALCVHLDGLPLAIELAAVRLKILSPHSLRRRLHHRLALLDQGPSDFPDRHRTLRATIDWSYRLLHARERRVFAQLAVFAGGWTLAAAEQICGGNDHMYGVLDDIAALCDAHLLTQDEGADGELRFSMLETIREYAAERLHEQPDASNIRTRHAAYYCDVVQHSGPRLLSKDLIAILDAFDQEYNNIRAALHWLYETGDHTRVAQMMCVLQDYWDTRGFMQEAQFWTERSLEIAKTLPASLAARLRTQAAFLAYRQGRAAADLIASVIADPAASPADRSQTWNVAGLMAQEAGDSAAALQHFEKALAIVQQHALLLDIAGVQLNIGLYWLTQGQLDLAEMYIQRSEVAHRHPRFEGSIQITQSYIALLRGDSIGSAKLLKKGLQLLQTRRHTLFQLYGLLVCASLAAAQHQPDTMIVLHSAAVYQAQTRGLVLSPSICGMIDQVATQVRDHMPPDAYNQAVQRGRMLTFDGALALADTVLATVTSDAPNADTSAT